jgi:3-deoxy-7-phosphoheptulonate synthase
MLVVMSVGATEEEIENVRRHIVADGLTPHESRGAERVVIGVVGAVGPRKEQVMGRLSGLPGVESVTPISRPFKLTSREFEPVDTIVRVGGATIGGGGLTVMAGPCSVESREQLMATADAVVAAGGTILRGGAFKPRTSPYSFQGLGEKGLLLLREAANARDMAVVTEVITPEDVPLVAQHADLLQVGARNMGNFALLRAVGSSGRPVLLKRGLGSTVDELLQAAEYVLASGNPHVAVCERGIRTFEPSTRFTLDINAVPVLKSLTSLPVVVDPSHAAGRAEWVVPVALAGVAAGADGLLVEVHPHPAEALSDGPQSLSPEAFADLMERARRVAVAVGREAA